jgi:hypothetical protein
MMCTDCFRTAEANTLLEGSDLVEMLAWCCFALPGLLYCWWRHALRVKVCASCGSRELIREARAAAERAPRQAPPAGGPRVRNLSGPVRWPRALAAPRARLRHGGVAACLVGTSLLCAVPALLNLAAADAALVTVHVTTSGFGVWLVYQAVRVAHMRATLPGCKAWDASGRPLRIERAL